MNKNIEKIDRHLKSVALPEHISEQHRRQLRRQILNRTERRQTMFVGKRAWKVAAVVAVVLGLGAISVVGVNIGRYYYYMGRNDDGAPIFRSEDFNVTVTLDDDEVTDVEQARRYLEEMKILSDQGKKELLKVEETMTDGTLEMRVHVYRYELSDGRTIDQREGGPEGAYALSEAQWQEWRQLKKAGPGEDLGTYEETVEGRVFSFKREKYFLSDGTEIIWSVGKPKDGQ
ncbi:MAG: hypothetical protein H8D56_05595 [Planctomycetes bacterium]|nr:hypothetical protein [Planctomycetota bacterium]MBL7146396.1 hypothetical protein [Phycisphaerae bacterium]